MNKIQFIEEILNIKLLDYQKRIIKEIDEHPDYRFIIPRKGKINQYLYFRYLSSLAKYVK